MSGKRSKVFIVLYIRIAKEAVNVENESKTTYYITILINQVLGGAFIGIGTYTKIPIWYGFAVLFIGLGVIRNFFLKRMLRR